MPYDAARNRIWETETETRRVTSKRTLLEGFEHALRNENDREQRARLEARIRELRDLVE